MTGAQTLKMLFVLKSAPKGAVAIVEEVLMILYKIYVNTYFFPQYFDSYFSTTVCL